MNYFIKRAFIISLFLTSSVFAAGKPVSWNYHPSNKNIIDIRDSESNHLALLTTADLPKGYSWTCNKFNIASIKNPAGQVIGQLQINMHPRNYQLIRYQNKIYLIPRRAQQRQASSTTSSATPPRHGAHQTSASAYRSIAPNPFYQARAAFSQTSSAPIQRPAYPTKDEAISQRSKEKGTLAEALRAAEAEDYNRPSSFPGQSRFAAKRTPTPVQTTDPMNVADQPPFSVIDLTGDPQSLPALPYQRHSINVEKSQPEASSTREQISTQKAMENVGKKRAREDETTDLNPAKRAKRDFDPKSVAYWRINPEQARYFQLCDADGTVLHTKKVRTQMGYRKLNNGYLSFNINRKQYRFKRDPNDIANLTDNGFAAGSNNSFKVYGQAYSRADPDADAIDLKTVAYWRINPEQKGYLQFCDQNGTVLHTEPVMIQHRKRRLHQSHQKKGTLRLNINRKTYFFKRDSNDLTNLVDSGFAEGSDDFFKAYGKVYKNNSLACLKSAAYWRIHPDQKGYLQLCDQNGTVLHTEEVRTYKGERKFNNGYLQPCIKGKRYYFKRDPKDTANLTDNGFAAGQVARTWKPSAANRVAKDLMDCEQETDNVSSSTHDDSETDDGEELSDDLLEFCDLLEGELSNDLLKFRNLLEETLASSS